MFVGLGNKVVSFELLKNRLVKRGERGEVVESVTVIF